MLHSHRLAHCCRVIGCFFSTARTNGRAVSLRDYKKASVEEKKIVFPIQASLAQYEFNIERESQLLPNRNFDFTLIYRAALSVVQSHNTFNGQCLKLYNYKI